MPMSLVRTVAPTVEPLTKAEVRRHLRIDAESVEPTPTAPTVALAGAGAGNVDNGPHRYRVTFVTADGETDGGDISSAVTVADKSVNGKVAITAVPVGGSLVTSRKIYRTVAAGSSYLLLTTLSDNTTTTYTDNTADASLGAGIPSTNTTGDPELGGLIASAREMAEDFLQRALVTQTWRYALDAFPACGIINLPRPNLLSVTHIRYTDQDGDEQTLDTDTYSADIYSLPGRIVREYQQVWPITHNIPSAVRVTYTAGYGATAASVPAGIRHGLLLAIGDLYANRESVNVGNIVNELPALKALWGPHVFRESR